MNPILPRRQWLTAGSASLGAAVLGLQTACAQAPTAGMPAALAGEPLVSLPKLANPAALRFVTCQFAQQQPARLGIVLGDGQVIDVMTQAQRHGMALTFAPDSMLGFLHSGEAGMGQMKALAGLAAQQRVDTVPLNRVSLASPIPKPQANIYCVGWNYLEHFEEGKEARADKAVTTYPEHPVFFTKGVHTMNSPTGSIPYDPGFTGMADWEAELAVVIGKRGRNISEAQAMDHVFGYCAYNDTTVRDVQQKLHGGQWFKGKSLDGYGPMGPWITMAGDVVLDDVRIILRVNGVEKQNGSYRQMFFKIPKIIAELSRNLTLEPGDIIATGTPPGVGYSRKPPEFLKPGDLMETEIIGVGTLRNRVMVQT